MHFSVFSKNENFFSWNKWIIPNKPIFALFLSLIFFSASNKWSYEQCHVIGRENGFLLVHGLNPHFVGGCIRHSDGLGAFPSSVLYQSSRFPMRFLWGFGWWMPCILMMYFLRSALVCISMLVDLLDWDCIKALERICSLQRLRKISFSLILAFRPVHLFEQILNLSPFFFCWLPWNFDRDQA